MPVNRSRIHFDNLYSEINKTIGPFTVYQIGDLTCEPGYVVDTHTQVVHEISLIVDGEGEFITNSKTLPVQKGVLYINRVGEDHKIVSSVLDRKSVV